MSNTRERYVPDEPTLGWLHVTDIGKVDDRSQGYVFGIFRSRQHHVDGGHVGLWSHECVTGFTPATPVPTTSYAALCDRIARHEFGTDDDFGVIGFVNEVDEANA